MKNLLIGGKLLLVSLVFLGLGCKKDDDAKVYQWKRDLYRAMVTNEGPASLVKDPRPGQGIFVSTDFVRLTESQKSHQQDSINRASDRLLAYKYEKVD